MASSLFKPQNVIASWVPDPMRDTSEQGIVRIQEARRQDDTCLKTALQQVQPMLNGVNAFLKHLFGVTTLVARSCSPRGMVSAD